MVHPGCTFTPKEIGRFEAKVNRVATPGGCHLWTAGARHGYGDIAVRGKHIKAHRMAWEIANGPIPDGLWVLHDCPAGDNPSCCNPAHLWLGTHADNMADMAAKGRYVLPKARASGERHGSRTHPECLVKSFGAANGAHTHPERRRRGQDHGRSKLTERDVREILCTKSTTEVSNQVLADRYKVGRRTIDRIVCRQTWGHLV